MRLYYFEKLDVWQLGRNLIKNVYQLSKKLPNDERFGMISQMRRAGISINCNLAEGGSRTSGKEQARFTEIAFGSLMELLNLLITAVDLEYLPQEDIDSITPLINDIGNKLTRHRESQLRKS
mgnify:CR=1 FL=1